MSLFSFWRRALALALCCNLAFAEGTAETKTMAPAVTLLRVSARPVATLSVEAQERHERKERTQRDDRE